VRTDEENVKSQVRKITDRLAQKVQSRVKGQTHGGIIDDPGPYVICPICTARFDTGHPYGVRRRDAKRHMADHKKSVG